MTIPRSRRRWLELLAGAMLAGAALLLLIGLRALFAFRRFGWVARLEERWVSLWLHGWLLASLVLTPELVAQTDWGSSAAVGRATQGPEFPPGPGRQLSLTLGIHRRALAGVALGLEAGFHRYLDDSALVFVAPELPESAVKLQALTAGEVQSPDFSRPDRFDPSSSSVRASTTSRGRCRCSSGAVSGCRCSSRTTPIRRSAPVHSWE